MKKYCSITHGNPSELEYYANKKEINSYEALKRSKHVVNMHNAEFERGRNVERGEIIERSQDGRRL